MEIANLIDHRIHHKNSRYVQQKLLSEEESIAIENYVKSLEKRVLFKRKTINNNHRIK